MRFTLLLLWILLFALFALPANTQRTEHRVYLPAVRSKPPAPVEPITLMLANVGSNLATSKEHTITNEQAAQSHSDPQAALAAFAQQGRQTAYTREWRGVQSGPTAILSQQVTRYATTEGARAGLLHQSEALNALNWGYGSAPDLGDFAQLRALRSTQDGRQIMTYLLLVQKGAFVTYISTTAWVESADIDILWNMHHNPVLIFLPHIAVRNGFQFFCHCVRTFLKGNIIAVVYQIPPPFRRLILRGNLAHIRGNKAFLLLSVPFRPSQPASCE